MAEQSRFVVDGCDRARAAVEAGIRAQVAAEFAAELAAAGFWQRFWLRRAIEHEVQLRLNKAAGPEALY